MSSKVQELVWLHYLLAGLDLHQLTSLPLLCDNNGAITLSSDPAFHTKLKCIDTQYTSLRMSQQQSTQPTPCCLEGQCHLCIHQSPPSRSFWVPSYAHGTSSLYARRSHTSWGVVFYISFIFIFGSKNCRVPITVSFCSLLLTFHSSLNMFHALRRSVGTQHCCIQHVLTYQIPNFSSSSIYTCHWVLMLPQLFTHMTKG